MSTDTQASRVDTPIWADDFDGTGPIDPARWRFETMHDGQHKVGNDGRDGWRHAARYDVLNDELARRVDGVLEMRSRVLNEVNPHRRDVVLDGVVHAYGSRTFVTSWIDTCGRAWSEAEQRHVRTGPAFAFGPGVRISTRVSFAGMTAPGARSSGWLMPAPELQADAYDGNPAAGAEQDIWEYDRALPYHLVCKVIGGKRANGTRAQTPDGMIDLRPFGIDLTDGYHVIDYYWLPERITWLVDGVEILRDEIHVPQTEHYLILSQELNSGARMEPRPGELQADPPAVPIDPGLHLASVAASAGLLTEHVVRIDYVRVYAWTGEAVEQSPADPADQAPVGDAPEKAEKKKNGKGRKTKRIRTTDVKADGPSPESVAFAHQMMHKWGSWIATNPEEAESREIDPAAMASAVAEAKER